MRWIIRMALLAAGTVVVAFGLEASSRGIFAYQNTWYRGTNYSSGTTAVGIFVALLAFLPPASWIARWTNPRKKPGVVGRQDHRGRR